MKKILFVFLFLSSCRLSAQSWENVQHTIQVLDKVTGTKIIDGDTILILGKKAATKYVDTLTLHKLSKKLDYGFILPDSLPDGKYGVYYNDKSKNLAFIVAYKNKKRNGAFKFFYYDGKTERMGFYLNNCLDQVLIAFLRSGAVARLCYFENCAANGSVYEFSIQGSLFGYSDYRDGKREGTLIQYNYDRKGFMKVRNAYVFKDGENTGPDKTRISK